MYTKKQDIENYIKTKVSCNEIESLCAQLSKKSYKAVATHLISITTELDKLTGKNYSRRLYHFYNNLKTIPLCKHCNDKEVKYDKFGTGYKTFCSVKCMRNSDDYNEKRKNTCISKYGVPFATQDENYKENLKQTWANKSKEDHILSSKKRKETCKEKYGVEHVLHLPKNLTKRDNTCKEKYGHSNPMQNKDIKEKAELTYLEKTGFINPSHNPEVMQKIIHNRYLKKEFIFPSGRSEIVQGYEPQAIKLLLRTYKEDDIVIKDTEIAKYTKVINYESNNTTHRYFPDIFIISENKIIEVKSPWTFDRNGADAELRNINNLKRHACENMGFCFEFMFFDK